MVASIRCGQTIPGQTLLAKATKHWPDSPDVSTVLFYQTSAGGYKIVISDTMDSTYDVAEHADPDKAREQAYAAIRRWYSTSDSVDDTPQACALAVACEETGLW